MFNANDHLFHIPVHMRPTKHIIHVQNWMDISITFQD